MKKAIFLLCLLCTLSAAAQKPARKAQKGKAKTEKTVKADAIPQGVSGAEFSYYLGLLQGPSLKQYLIQREGVDSALVEEAIRGMRSKVDPQEAKKQRAFFAGLDIATTNREQVIPAFNRQATGTADTVYMDADRFIDGLVEAMRGTTNVSPDSARTVVEKQIKRQEAIVKKLGADFLAQNAKKPGVRQTASGLQYRILTEGKGAVAADTTQVEVNYEGSLIDGTVFDSSYKRGKTATFRPDQVIKGWHEALTMMPEGSTWELFIPYELGYGERGAGENIPPFATLLFKVEVVKVGK